MLDFEEHRHSCNVISISHFNSFPQGDQVLDIPGCAEAELSELGLRAQPLLHIVIERTRHTLQGVSVGVVSLCTKKSSTLPN